VGDKRLFCCWQQATKRKRATQEVPHYSRLQIAFDALPEHNNCFVSPAAQQQQQIAPCCLLIDTPTTPPLQKYIARGDFKRADFIVLN
jgi:hypothetical protein